MEETRRPKIQAASPEGEAVTELKTVAEGDDDDLTGDIGIELETGEPVPVDAPDPPIAAAPPVAEEPAARPHLLGEIGARVAETVRESVMERIERILVNAIESAVTAELERLKSKRREN